MGHLHQLASPEKIEYLPHALVATAKLTTRYQDELKAIQAKESANKEDETASTHIEQDESKKLGETHGDLDDGSDGRLTPTLEQLLTAAEIEQSEEDECTLVGMCWDKCVCPKCQTLVTSLISEDEQAPQTPPAKPRIDSGRKSPAPTLLESGARDSSDIARAAPVAPAGKGAQKVEDGNGSKKQGLKRKRKNTEAGGKKLDRHVFEELSPRSKHKAVVRTLVRRRLREKQHDKNIGKSESSSGKDGQPSTSLKISPSSRLRSTSKAQTAKAKAKSEAASPKRSSTATAKPRPSPKKKPARAKAKAKAKMRSRVPDGPDEFSAPPHIDEFETDFRLPIQIVVRSPQNSRVGEAYLLQCKGDTKRLLVICSLRASCALGQSPLVSMCSSWYGARKATRNTYSLSLIEKF